MYRYCLSRRNCPIVLNSEVLRLDLYNEDLKRFRKGTYYVGSAGKPGNSLVFSMYKRNKDKHV